MIIGLTGYAQHGKDTVGRYLVEKYGFRRYAFADQLKSMAVVLNPIVYGDDYETLRLRDLVEREGWDEAKKDQEVRRFLQVLGTEAVREHLGKDAWIDALDKRLNDDGRTRSDSIVITDVRFPNEAQFVRRNGGEVWRIHRIVRTEHGDFTDFDNGLGVDHPSEKFVNVIKVNHVIIAESLDDLQMLVESRAEELRRRV